MKPNLSTIGKIEQGVKFTASVRNFTAYRMRGVDGIVVRKKGGAFKKGSKAFSGPAILWCAIAESRL